MEPAFEIVKLIALCLTALLSVFLYLKYGNKIQLTEAIKSKALGDVFFLYEANSKIYSTTNKKILELEVKVSNQSLSKLAILAIFVRFKPVFADSEQTSKRSLIDFENLPGFSIDNEGYENTIILNFRNIAFAKGFFWQTSVNGVSVKRGFDILSEEFCKKYPIIMAQIIIYGASTKFIDKTHFPKYRIDKLRIPFCNFLEEKNKENYDFFNRMTKAGYINRDGRFIKFARYFKFLNLLKSIKYFNYFEIKEGERIIINKDGSLDIENTRRFFPILKSIINSNIEKIIELSV